MDPEKFYQNGSDITGVLLANLYQKTNLKTNSQKW